MNQNALVLGARAGTDNIGDAIVDRINSAPDGWEAVGDSCWYQGAYRVPGQNAYTSMDALIVSLGFMQIKEFHVMQFPDVGEVIEACLTKPLHAIHRYLRARDYGTVIVIGSYAHDHVLSNSVPYCAAKAAMTHAVRCLAWDYGRDFRFNTLNPYHVEGTPMYRDVVKQLMTSKGMSEGAAIEYMRKDLRRSPLTAQDVAAFVHSLLLQDRLHSYINGQPINLYGGVR